MPVVRNSKRGYLGFLEVWQNDLVQLNTHRTSRAICLVFGRESALLAVVMTKNHVKTSSSDAPD